MKDSKKISVKKIILIIVGVIVAVIIGIGIYIGVLFGRLAKMDITTEYYEEPTLSTTVSEEEKTTAAETTTQTTETTVTENTATAENTTAETIPAGDEKQTVTEAATKGETEEKTTSSPAVTQAPVTETTTNATETTANEYDTYRSAHFYATGKMIDSAGTSPLEIAVTDSSMYMITDLDGITLGILTVNGNYYILMPDDNAYAELSQTLMKMIGVTEDDFLGLGIDRFAKMKPLDKANTVANSTVNGVKCKQYTFIEDDGGVTRVYMNGNKMVEMEEVDADGTLSSTMLFDKITSEVPADKSNISSAYKKMNILSFMKKLAELEG